MTEGSAKSVAALLNLNAKIVRIGRKSKFIFVFTLQKIHILKTFPPKTPTDIHRREMFMI